MRQLIEARLARLQDFLKRNPQYRVDHEGEINFLNRLLQQDPERAKTAQYRFYLYTGKLSDKYPYSICDAQAEPKTLAKVKDRNLAERFLETRRQLYVQTGE